MKYIRYNLCRVAITFLMSVCVLFGAAGAGTAMSVDELKKRVEVSTKNFRDLIIVGNVVEKNKDVLAKLEPAYVQLYEFKSAQVTLKMPDKLRIEGKLGMVKFEYIINSGVKIVRSPTLRINKKQDYSSKPAKLQTAFDMGLVTPTMWLHREVEIIDDSEAKANGEIKLRMQWKTGDMDYFVWLDAENLWLKKLEKRDGAGNLEAQFVYSKPKELDDVIWLPTRIEMYSPEGELAGAFEYVDIKVNTGCADSLFE